MNSKKLLPPIYFQICLLAEIILNFTFPIAKIIKTPYSYFGVLLIILGIALNIWTDILFKKKKTTIKPFEKPSTLIIKGPFLFSRHPIYLGLVFILFGLAIMLGNLTPFLGPIALFTALDKLFIPYEEKKLEQKFKKKYKKYKNKIRRWL